MEYSLKNEIARKLIHLASAVIPLSYIYIINDLIIMLCILSLFVVFSFFIEILRRDHFKYSKIFLRFFGFMLRDNEKKDKLTGATWVFLGALFTFILIPYPFSILALLFLSVGDTFAAIIGISFPYIKIGNKTLSGFFAGFISSILVGICFNLPVSIYILIFGALMASVIEIIPISVNDNITIPLFSGSMMYFASII